PRRLPSTRRAVPGTRLAQINQAAATTGNDPELDTLLLRVHTETDQGAPSPRHAGRVVIPMAALTAGTRRDRATEGPAMRGLAIARTDGPAAVDRSPAAARPRRTVRSWPSLVLAAPVAAEVRSGWVGIAQKTGFGRVSLLPGIWPSLHLDTTIT